MRIHRDGSIETAAHLLRCPRPAEAAVAVRSGAQQLTDGHSRTVGRHQAAGGGAAGVGCGRELAGRVRHQPRPPVRRHERCRGAGAARTAALSQTQESLLASLRGGLTLSIQCETKEMTCSWSGQGAALSLWCRGLTLSRFFRCRASGGPAGRRWGTRPRHQRDDATPPVHSSCMSSLWCGRYSFAAGTTDGPGAADIATEGQGMTEGSPLWDTIRDVLILLLSSETARDLS